MKYFSLSALFFTTANFICSDFRPKGGVKPDFNPAFIGFRDEATVEMLRLLQPYLGGGDPASAFEEWPKVLDAAIGVVGPFRSLRAPPFNQHPR